MHKRRDQSGSHESSHGIDLAPMLDFVINLLIFFIITAVFVKESGVTLNRPTDVDRDTEKLSKVIQIDENGEIWLDARLVDVRAVRANVERMKAEDADTGVVISAQVMSPTGTLIAVADQVRLGGIDDITFSTTAAVSGL